MKHIGKVVLELEWERERKGKEERKVAGKVLFHIGKKFVRGTEGEREKKEEERVKKAK